MRTTWNTNPLQPKTSVEIPSNAVRRKDSDTVSFSSLRFDDQYHPSSQSNSNTFPAFRRSLNKRFVDSVSKHQDSYDHGLMINTSFFDGHLFQPARSSFILDHKDAPKDLNRFLEGHRNSESAQLDAHLFKLSFILMLSDWHMDKISILDFFPRDENDDATVKEIENYGHFCFPEWKSHGRDPAALNSDSSTYVFTRTLSDGQVEYGYCRRIRPDLFQNVSYPIVICIVSAYTYFKLYDAILNELTSIYVTNELECSLLIQSFYSKPIPVPTATSSGIVCILHDRRIFFYVCPRDDRLNHDYFSTLISCLSPNHIVLLFESMLASKRILCFSNSLSKLTKCCLGLSFLLYPFIWPYSFASLMPSSWLRDLLDSPCPFIYGCLHEMKANLPSTLDKETLRVDLDADTIEIEMNEEYPLPTDLRQTLLNSLEYIVRFRLVKLDSLLINIAVSEACLRVFIELFYRLPDHFNRIETETSKSFDRKRSNSKSSPRNDSGIDLQSLTSTDTQREPKKNEHQTEENRLGYSFHSDDFLICQPTSGYVNFLNDFIHGMIFLKFLDDYQRVNEHTSPFMFSLFAQRLKERRRMTTDELTVTPILRFRQTFDLLEKQIRHASRTAHPIFPNFMKKLFE